MKPILFKVNSFKSKIQTQALICILLNKEEEEILN